MNKAQVRLILLFASAIIGTALATMFWMANQSVDIYALMDRLNSFLVAVTGLVTTIGVLVATIYGVVKSATKPLLQDAVQAPDAKDAAAQIPVSPHVVEVAEALKNGH